MIVKLGRIRLHADGVLLLVWVGDVFELACRNVSGDGDHSLASTIVYLTLDQLRQLGRALDGSGYGSISLNEHRLLTVVPRPRGGVLVALLHDKAAVVMWRLARRGRRQLALAIEHARAFAVDEELLDEALEEARFALDTVNT